MKISVSSLSFTGSGINEMAQLPKEFGIEIFYEWGGRTYWKKALNRIMEDREGGFSIHSPFINTDLSSPEEDTKRLFEYLREPFDLYHKYNGDCYVVHTNGIIPSSISDAEAEDRRKLVQERLVMFNEICEKVGVTMAVENLGFGKGKRTLYNQEQFLKIFADAPELNCIIDTGHGLIEDYDCYKIQETLKDRLIAYHIHDNDGLGDQHMRITEGNFDWNRFAEGFKKFTPNATLTLEYNRASLEEYNEDGRMLHKILEGGK